MFSVFNYPMGVIPAKEPESSIWITAGVYPVMDSRFRGNDAAGGSCEYKNLFRMLNKYEYCLVLVSCYLVIFCCNNSLEGIYDQIK